MRCLKLIPIGIVFTGSLVFVAPAFAGEKDGRANDEKSINLVTEAWRESWNKHDATALAALVVDDVDFVRAIGPEGWLKGRKQFQDFHAEIHKRYFKGSEWATKETRIRFLRPELAVAHVVWSIEGDTIPEPDRKPGQPREGIFTWILEKQGGRWLIVASHNSEAPPPGRRRPLDEYKSEKPNE